jgi:hypothetical protein
VQTFCVAAAEALVVGHTQEGRSSHTLGGAADYDLAGTIVVAGVHLLAFLADLTAGFVGLLAPEAQHSRHGPAGSALHQAPALLHQA